MYGNCLYVVTLSANSRFNNIVKVFLFLILSGTVLSQHFPPYNLLIRSIQHLGHVKKWALATSTKLLTAIS